MGNEDYESHPSWGVIGISRTSCGGRGQRLFNSPLNHDNYLTIEIRQAEKKRSLSNDWIHGRESIVEVAMSEAQFSQLLTSPGINDGVPCTIRRIGKERIPEVPVDDIKENFQNEFREKISTVSKEISDLVGQVQKLTQSSKLSKAEKAELLSLSGRISTTVVSNIPYVQDQFVEAMEKVVHSAKVDFDSHITQQTHLLGLKALEHSVASETFLAAPELEEGVKGSVIDGVAIKESRNSED